MTTKVQFEWIDEGFHEILNCPELGDVCEDAAKKIAQTAGQHYSFERWHSNMKGGRIAARAVCADENGKWAEAKNRTLSKAAMKCQI